MIQHSVNAVTGGLVGALPRDRTETVFALGVPVELRPMVEAAVPECTFHFISIHKSLTEQSERILKAHAAFVASWGGAVPGDYAAFIERTQLPSGRIGPAGLFMQSHPGIAALEPCGVFLEAVRPDMLSRQLLPFGTQNVLPPLPGASADNVDELIRQYLTNSLSRHNFGRLHVRISQPRAVLVIADDTNPFAHVTQERFLAYETLARTAREHHPNRKIVFVTNGDNHIPEDCMKTIWRFVDDVADTYYSPALLHRSDAVMTHNSVASLDAALLGKSVHTIGNGQIAAGLRSGDAKSLLFQREFVTGIRYVDPDSLRAMHVGEAFRMVADRMSQTPSPRSISIGSTADREALFVELPKRADPVALKNAAARGDLVATLAGLAAHEREQLTAPHVAGVLIQKYLSTNEGLAKLAEAAAHVARDDEHSILLTYLQATGLAQNENLSKAHDIVARAIIDSRLSAQRQKHISKYADRQTSAFVRIWRTIDEIARDNMSWLTDAKGAPLDYSALDFLDVSDNKLDAQLSLFLAEPYLQGRDEEKYLLACQRAYDEVETLSDKLKVISAMHRTGVRRLRDYHKAYDLSRSLYKELRPNWEKLLRFIENASSRPLKSPLLLARQIRQVMNIARALGFRDDVDLLADTMRSVAFAPWGKETVWVAAYALAEIDPIGNRRMTIDLVDRVGSTPKEMMDIQDFLSWANLVQEYERADAFMEQQPIKIRRHRAGLVYANILQRMGRFRDAESVAREVQAAMLARPHSFCPYTLFNVNRRVGELKFAAETAEIYSLVPQPNDPKGVIFVTQRTLEQLRRIPIVVMMELKRMGWAVIPLTEGLLPIEKTGIEAIDRFAGCVTLNRGLNRHVIDNFKNPEDFDFRPSTGELYWRGMDMSHPIWEEATVNRRAYDIDYTCPSLQKYVGNLVRWTEVYSAVLVNLHDEMEKLDMRTGLLIQFGHRLPDALFRKYCDKFGDPNRFFCLHAANGYQNYFANFSTNVSTKAVISNVTRNPEVRSASFPIPSEFEEYVQKNRSLAYHVLEQVQDVTKVRRSTEGQDSLPLEARIALARIKEWRAKGGKIACAFGKVVCDSSVLFDGGPAHKNMKDWINHTIACVRDSNTLLLIKPHPHELKEEIACFLNQYFFDLIETDLPENVILVGHRWFDIYSLQDFTDLGLIYNGTTAIELGLLGIPTVLCGHFAPIDYPIGHVAVQSREHYRSLVRFEKPAIVAEDIRERAALWLRYMSDDNIVLNYRYHARQITNKRLYPSWWFEEDLRRYFSKGDPCVARLAEIAVRRSVADNLL